MRPTVDGEGCEFYIVRYAIKRNYGDDSRVYGRNEAFSDVSCGFLRPAGGLSDIVGALEKSAERLGVKVYAREKVKTIY